MKGGESGQQRILSSLFQDPRGGNKQARKRGVRERGRCEREGEGRYNGRLEQSAYATSTKVKKESTKALN